MLSGVREVASKLNDPGTTQMIMVRHSKRYLSDVFPLIYTHLSKLKTVGRCRSEPTLLTPRWYWHQVFFVIARQVSGAAGVVAGREVGDGIQTRRII